MILLPIAAALFAASFGHAEDDYPIYVYPAPEARPAPRVDGVLDDATWPAAPLVGGFTLYDRPEKVEVQTFFRVAWDARNLYLGIRCDEPLMSKVSPVACARDDHEVFHGEAVELFLDPTHDQSHYYQLAVSAGGSLYDSERTDPSWNSDAEAKVSLGEASWTVEMAIPWHSLVGAKPRAGAVMSLNVCRDRYVSPSREWTNWSQTKANFHDPERFAPLVLSPTPQELGKLGPEFRRGGRTGPIVVFSSEGFSGASYAALADQAFAHLDGLLADLDKTRGEEQDPEAARLLGDLLAQRRREVEALRTGLGAGKPVDAAVWSRTDVAIQKLQRTLGEMIWQARLSALLSQL